jgi:hypothetical protein
VPICAQSGALAAGLAACHRERRRAAGAPRPRPDSHPGGAFAAYKTQTKHAKPEDYVFATATGKADTSSNIARRLKRAVARANKQLAVSERVSPIPIELSPHSLRRTFASLLYLRGENPVYVMHQMGHTDPELALRIYTKVMGEQRRRGPGARLVGVLDGAHWTHDTPSDEPSADRTATIAVGRVHDRQAPGFRQTRQPLRTDRSPPATVGARVCTRPPRPTRKSAHERSGKPPPASKPPLG